MMRTSALGGVLAVALTLPAFAQTFQTPRPLAQKYSDAGIKPATGRSGSASLEVRALIDSGGSTLLEVTTGQLEGTAPRGSIAKAQVKVFNETGNLLQTDNYRKTLTGEGYASFTYDALRRGHLMQVQANVTGIDPNRTDVVTVSAPVMRRPDLAALQIDAPAQVLVGAPVMISGLVGEVNGDVGARSTCRLLVDGTEVGAVPGIWVDAASSVSCAFPASFSSVGTKQLTLVVSDAVPADDSAGNNSVTASISVVDPQRPFSYMSAWAGSSDYSYLDTYDLTFTSASNGAVSTRSWIYNQEQHNQWLGAYGQVNQAAGSDAIITLRHTMDGVALPVVSVAAADIPLDYWNGYCRQGQLSMGLFAYYCGYPGQTVVQIYRQGGRATYLQGYTTSGDRYGSDSYWYSNTNEYGPDLVIGTNYVVELELSSSSVQARQSLNVNVDRYWYGYNYDTGRQCSTSSWYEGVETYCWQYRRQESQRYGDSYTYN